VAGQYPAGQLFHDGSKPAVVAVDVTATATTIITAAAATAAAVADFAPLGEFLEDGMYRLTIDIGSVAVLIHHQEWVQHKQEPKADHSSQETPC